MSTTVRRWARAGVRSLVAATWFLLPAVACAGGGKPAMPHFSPPKMPQFHFTPPKMPQMHFTPPKMPNVPAQGFVPGLNFHMPSKPPLGLSHAVKPAHAHNLATPVSTSAATTNHPTTTAATSVPTTRVTTGGGSRRYYSRGGRGYYGYRRPYYRRTYRPTGTVNGPMRRLQKLIADLDALRPGTQTTQVQINMLTNDLLAVSEAAPKPTAPPVQQLANDLSQALTHRTIPLLNTMELAGDLKAVMNPAHLARADINMAIKEAQTLMKGSGVKRADVQTVSNDLKTVMGSVPNQALGLIH